MSDIEWTDETWNPVTGCTQISPGCENCYALRMSHRLQAMGVDNYRNAFELTTHDHVLEKPLSWKKPRKVFVNSMSDLFHRDVPVEFIERVFDVCRRAHWHQFQILTKRSQRLAREADRFDWPDNVWIGTSVESQDYTFRVDHLRQVPAAVRFISFEPLIGPVDRVDLTGIDWAIVGGESGPGSRPSHPDWFRKLRKLCEKQDTAFFFKQYGDYAPAPEGTAEKKIVKIGRQGDIRDRSDKKPRKTDAAVVRMGKGNAGRTLDGQTWDAYPEVVT
ncbi:Phage protein Gp37/Gp68 [Novipirellula aureliae]|uniref:Phage protein Gp37/Gp68 n=1 Tax=Novipirellula aureliae TaxID=2527966 RepID=A0A5C6DSY5_9BACT|nr:phage Gp37/Gp68 family protein [Novipirellula aureliae]TWU39830.1 Phage protein Gp37/Gp68 [Novipirellula aureliae]